MEEDGERVEMFRSLVIMLSPSIERQQSNIVMDVRRVFVGLDNLGIDSMVHFYIEGMVQQRVYQKELRMSANNEAYDKHADRQGILLKKRLFLLIRVFIFHSMH